jgi:TonB family protein
MRTERQDANTAWKRRQEDLFWPGLTAAVVVHFMVLAFWPAMLAADMSGSSEEVPFIVLPPEIVIPPPPEQITRPAMPVVSETAIDDVTMAPTTFDAQMPRELPRMPTAQAAADAGNFVVFVPTMLPPRILNVDEVERTLQRQYPALLRDSGIGGTVEVLIWLGADGTIHRAEVGQSSGHATMDAAALKVVDVMRLSPAQNRSTAVAVMVSVPVVFQAR